MDRFAMGAGSRSMVTSADRIYRFSIWLPLIVPVAVIAIYNILVKGLGAPEPSGVFDVALERVAYSAIYGGLPYLLLAVWALWWIRGRPEPSIRRLMFMAPLLMVVVFGAGCLVMGILTGRIQVWMSVAWLGIRTIVPLGYGYVALTLALRHWLGPRAA